MDDCQSLSHSIKKKQQISINGVCEHAPIYSESQQVCLRVWSCACVIMHVCKSLTTAVNEVISQVLMDIVGHRAMDSTENRSSRITLLTR